MNNIVKKKKKKFKKKSSIIIFMAIISVPILFTVFGTIDYFRATMGKRPMFIYRTINIESFDVAVGFSENVILSIHGSNNEENIN